ncbi:hypothetical protein CPB84DRAFT_1965229 [Gymnopilus junonius]|uniref:Uncharacterized protein n=1 Tax=Gymnopilus junonius TaxID=109634 RepID=A0A9P5NEN5_GYMJU|nr:hypothetical protein CPB84DRAFT_1965229 [Gymnopilus junonius]
MRRKVGCEVSHPVFGQLQSATTSAFGQPSQPSTITTSAFGQPAFGQPSAFGQAPPPSSTSIIKPASGAFSAFSGSGPSAFGVTSTPCTDLQQFVITNSDQYRGNKIDELGYSTERSV